MPELFGADVYTPREVARRVTEVGVIKARLPITSMAMLGMLAGGFIGLGAVYYTLVVSDATLSVIQARLLGGLCFCLGLLLVVVAGAELFTGNNLLVMAWVERKISTTELLRNWVVICLSNAVGAVGLAWLVLLSGHLELNDGGVGRQAVALAVSKLSVPLEQVFVRAVLCNVLVCLAVWMSMAGRSVIDKAIAIVFPISAFVAAGFEHSVANMYFLPLALMKQAVAPVVLSGSEVLGLGSALLHTGVVIAGNLVGGAGLVAIVYHVIYLRGQPGPMVAKSEPVREHHG